MMTELTMMLSVDSVYVVCVVFGVFGVFGVFFEATVMDRADGREGSSE